MTRRNRSGTSLPDELVIDVTLYQMKCMFTLFPPSQHYTLCPCLSSSFVEKIGSLDSLRREITWMRSRLLSSQFPLVLCHNDTLMANFILDEDTGMMVYDRKSLWDKFRVVLCVNFLTVFLLYIMVYCLWYIVEYYRYITNVTVM